MSRFLPSPLITKALNPSSAYSCLTACFIYRLYTNGVRPLL